MNRPLAGSALLPAAAPPKFSVVVTNYNYGRYVGEAIDSALAQTVAPLEVVVVDDGSTDGSRELLQQRHDRRSGLRLLFKDNGGQLSAFMAGVRACHGDVVCFLDADDCWEPDYLESLATAYAGADTPDFVFANLRYFGAREGLWRADTQDRDYGLSVLSTLFLHDWIGAPTSALSLRRELAAKALDLPAPFLEDWRLRADDCLIYAAGVLGARKRYVGAARVRYRVHDANLHLNRPVDRCAAVRNHYRIQKLLRWFGTAAGFGPWSLRFAKEEFKTKPSPTREELGAYLKLLRQSQMPWSKRIEHGWSMRMWFLRGRRRGR